MRPLATVIDQALEASVAGSFTRIGPAIRRRLEGWPALGPRAPAGHRIAITGITSGIGREAARQCAAAGASLLLLVRDTHRGMAVAQQLTVPARQRRP